MVKRRKIIHFHHFRSLFLEMLHSCTYMNIRAYICPSVKIRVDPEPEWKKIPLSTRMGNKAVTMGIAEIRPQTKE